MFIRQIESVLSERLKQFPIVVLTGPRQSGKTTLLQEKYQHYLYINLESPAVLDQIRQDPLAILDKNYPHGLIIDEAQKLPELFSYIQVISDKNKKKGQFILSGSQNFLLNQQITQSLAGRAGLLTLLPLTYSEYLTHPNMTALDLWSWLYHGSYPRPYHDHIPIKVWADSYIQTYLERDVRDLLNVQNLITFQKFLRLCAGRHGQLLNIHQLAIDCGISHTTLTEWLNILEASYILFRLPPYYKNFNKRLVKSAKLYFYDPSLVCYLLGIDSPEYLSIHAARGAIFEGYVISEIKKYFINTGDATPLYFWRDSNGNEVDCLFEKQGDLHAIEIKSTETFRTDLLKGLQKWDGVIQEPKKTHLIYAGQSLDPIKNTTITSWNNINSHLLEHY